MKKIVFICLVALSINSVLIQTITTENDFLKNMVRVLVLLIMIFCMLLKNHKISLMIFYLTDISAILLIIRHNLDQSTFIFIFIFVQSLFLIKTKNIEKYLLISSLISLAMVFAFLLLGITQNQILDYRNRMTFGTNGVPFFYNLVYGAFSLLVVYSRKYFSKFKWSITLISLGITTYLYIKTNARGGYYSFIIFIILLYLLPKMKNIKIIKIVIALIPEACLGISFYIASLNNNYNANLILSFRPILLNNFFNNLDWADVIGSKSVKAFDKYGTIVDNSYVHLLVGGGIIFSLAIGYLFFVAILNMYKEKKYIEISFMVSTCIYFNMESIMVRMENMFVIYFWYLLFKYSTEKKLNRHSRGCLFHIQNKKERRNINEKLIKY